MFLVSCFLQTTEAVMTARSGSTFNVDGPVYQKTQSPYLVRNRGSEKSDVADDRGRYVHDHVRHISPMTAFPFNFKNKIPLLSLTVFGILT